MVLNTETGNIYFASEPDYVDDVGSYPGVPKDPITLAFLDGFVDPNPLDGGDTSSGLFSEATTPLFQFVGLRERIIIENQFRSFKPCINAPQAVLPFLHKEASVEAVDESIYSAYSDKRVVSGAYHFEKMDFATSEFEYDVYYNLTGSGGFDLPLLINFISNAIWRHQNPTTPTTFLTFSGNKNNPIPPTEVEFDLISLTGPFIYHFIFQLLWPVMLQGIVHEKENKLREIMLMMGMRTEIYWLATYIFYYCLYLFTTFLTVAVACIFGFRFFLYNNFLVYFLMFFLWGHTMVAAALLLSIFFTKERTALVVGYFVILANGILAQSWVFSYLDQENPPPGAVFGISVFPPWTLYRGIIRLSNAVAFYGPGISISEITDPFYAMDEVYLFLFVQWIVCLLLAIYLENVLPIGPGIKKHPLFFLPRRFWCCTRQRKVNIGVYENPDIEEEKKRVLENADGNYIIRILGLTKIFYGGRKKVAVNNLTMGIKKNECFGFLGPNGAGKTTTIGMLCGYHRPTAGNAYLGDLDINYDIGEIHMQMGVCPQEDLLWADLTGPEHLYFYGRLKNLRGKELDDQVEYWLKQVNLADKKTKRKLSCEYSGGMKRRLSVAISLIGNSKYVLLDEPTTGLDPASRKDLWEVILKVKKHCSILLTTHSMEEAETLCDRLSIFADGGLLSVGTSAELKNQYGQYYKVLIATKPSDESKALEFMHKVCGKDNVRLVNILAGTGAYEVPKDSIALSKLSRNIQECTDVEILHYGITSATLEEVFVKLTLEHTKDEAETLTKKKKKENDVEIDMTVM